MTNRFLCLGTRGKAGQAALRVDIYSPCTNAASICQMGEPKKRFFFFLSAAKNPLEPQKVLKIMNWSSVTNARLEDKRSACALQLHFQCRAFVWMEISFNDSVLQILVHA